MVQAIYRVIDALPQTERFNLADQMRRASVSVVSNIAEGSRRVHKKEKRQFYSIAYGSASELEAQLTVIEDMNMVPFGLFKEAFDNLQQVLRLMNLLVQRFR